MRSSKTKSDLVEEPVALRSTDSKASARASSPPVELCIHHFIRPGQKSTEIQVIIGRVGPLDVVVVVE